MTDSTGRQSRDGQLFHIADQQAGYFTASQAKGVGFSAPQLTYHVRTGRFVRAKWGIYRLVLYPSSPHEDLFVACLQAGPRAVISHNSALALYELSDALPAKTHITVPRTASRRRPNVALHTNHLDDSDTTTVAGLPVTTVARTIADVASSGMDEVHVIQAVKQAIARGLVLSRDLKAYVEARGGRPQRLVSAALEENTR